MLRFVHSPIGMVQSPQKGVADGAAPSYRLDDIDVLRGSWPNHFGTRGPTYQQVPNPGALPCSDILTGRHMCHTTKRLWRF
jgi:hypothetical protein